MIISNQFALKNTSLAGLSNRTGVLSKKQGACAVANFVQLGKKQIQSIGDSKSEAWIGGIHFTCVKTSFTACRTHE